MEPIKEEKLKAQHYIPTTITEQTKLFTNN